MTGYAQVRSDTEANGLAFALSLKSVNHRYLDLQMRMPAECDALEMKLRRLLKEKMVRGHVDLTLSLERGPGGGMQPNLEMIGAYVKAFRAAAKEVAVSGDPDLNAVLRMPGALSGAGGEGLGEEFEAAVLAKAGECVERLNAMREEEGRGMEQELRRCMARLAESTAKVEGMRTAVSRAYFEKVQARMSELVGTGADPDRVLQESAMLAERSDIQEEIVRLQTHIQHFLGLLGEDAEIGKKLDFLLQEMNREANTLLSKTAGVAGEGLNITSLGLAMKSEIEKAREQIQNIE